MSKLQARLLVFFVGLPAIAALIIFLPNAHHLGLNIAIAGIFIIGSGELVELYRKRGVRLTKSFILPLSAIALCATYLEMAGLIGTNAYFALLISPFFLIVLRHIFVPKNGFDSTLSEVGAAFSAILYPGYFGLFLIRIATLPYPVFGYLSFLSAVFANDTAAYVFGMLFGKSTRGVSKISPNKSIPGFIAGPVFSVVVTWLFFIGKRSLFGDNLLLAFVTGAAVGIATIIGDLFESAIKRSAGVKDSGILIPGRGGVLDSVDSVVIAAPVFYFLISLV